MACTAVRRVFVHQMFRLHVKPLANFRVKDLQVVIAESRVARASKKNQFLTESS